MKTIDVEERKKIANLGSDKANEAKKMGRKVTLREDWEELKYSVMYYAVKQKFEQDAALAKLLLSTRDRWIIEWTWWGDKVWGMHSTTSQGCNALGKILMRVRQELRCGTDSELMKKYLGSVNQCAVDSMLYHLKMAVRSAGDSGSFTFDEARQIVKESLECMPRPLDSSWADMEKDIWA